MESLLPALIGILVISATSYDAMQTTLSASNSGPITNRLVSSVWYVLLLFHRRREHHALLSAAGPWVTLSLVLVWVGLAWIGWWLVFVGDPQAVVNDATGAQASVVERGYFIGYTVTTLGYGDFVPGSGVWQLLAIMAAGNGLILFTLAVTYIVSVVSAVTQKRQLALSIAALGDSPDAILANTKGEGDFSELGSHVSTLQGTILSVSQEHLAYPILHYYHEQDAQGALPVQLSRLYQVLSALSCACPSLPASVQQQLKMGLFAIDIFLDTLSSGFVEPTRDPPEIPKDRFFDNTCFDSSASEIRSRLASLDNQRLLQAYVIKDGWEWDDLW